MTIICKEIKPEYMPANIRTLYQASGLKCFYVKRSENSIPRDKTGVLVDTTRRFVFVIAEDCKGMTADELEATYLYGYIRAYAEVSHDEAVRFVEQAASDQRAAKRAMARFNVLKMRNCGQPAFTRDEWDEFEKLSADLTRRLFGDIFRQLDKRLPEDPSIYDRWIQ